jgi:hypothetical protein
MDRPLVFPPTGIKPLDEYGGYGLCTCRTEDKKSVIIYPDTYRPQNDPWYEDPNGSAHTWQNQSEAMEQLDWLKKIHEIIGAGEPTSHPHIQKSVVSGARRVYKTDSVFQALGNPNRNRISHR